MTPSIGRIVHYTLSAEDAAQINRRRTTGSSIATRITAREWPVGAQAHVGPEAAEGETLPMIIVKVHDASDGTVNGKVMLNGSDELWVQFAKASPGAQPGCWCWPPRA